MNSKFKIIGLLSVILMLAFSGCSSQSNSDSFSSGSMEMDIPPEVILEKELYYADEEYVQYAPEEASDESKAYPEQNLNSMSNDTDTQQEKRIKDTYMDVESNNFDIFIDHIKSITNDSGGYVENYISNIYSVTSSNRELKNGHFVARIPAEKYDEVIVQLKSICKVKNFNENETVVTEQYYDIQTRMDSKLVQEERLLQMIEQAKDVEDLINLERNLSEVRETIELYQSQLKSIDNKVKYSTITIDITEVTDEVLQYVSDDFGTQLKNGFKKSVNSTVIFFENVVLFLAGSFVQIIIIAISLLVAFSIYRIRRKRSDKKKAMENTL